jgi:hypothetical protein
MSANPPYEPEACATALVSRQAVPHAAAPASRGSPEGHFLSGAGKPEARQLSDLQHRGAAAAAAVTEAAAAVGRAKTSDRERKDNHRGGDRTWMLRGLILVVVLAETITAYVAMEALVSSQVLATGLSLLAALVGAGLACGFANRRLNRLTVSAAVRALEVTFVAVLTALRADSLSVQGADLLTAAGGAALTALVSMLGLLGIEEIVVETRTFGMFLSSLWVSWRSWRLAAAGGRRAKIQARTEAAADKLQVQFLKFLLKADEPALEQAKQRAAALRAALTDHRA